MKHPFLATLIGCLWIRLVGLGAPAIYGLNDTGQHSFVSLTPVQDGQVAADTCTKSISISGGYLSQSQGILVLGEMKIPQECLTAGTAWTFFRFGLGGMDGPRGSVSVKRTADNSGMNVNFSLSGSSYGPPGPPIPSPSDSTSPPPAPLPQPNPYTIEYQLPGGSGENSGSGSITTNAVDWVPGAWYTAAIRRWDSANGKTNYGLFIYNSATSTWSHYATIGSAGSGAYLYNPSIWAYLSQSGSSPVASCGYWRNFWQLFGGTNWAKAEQFYAYADSGPSWPIEQPKPDEIKVSTCSSLSAGTPVNLTILGNKPLVAVPASITRLTPGYANGKLTVNWQIDVSKAPQLAYEIQVYDNPDFTGTPIAQVSDVQPETRSAVLPMNALTDGKYHVRLRVTDIFDQQSEALTAYFTTKPEGCACPD